VSLTRAGLVLRSASPGSATGVARAVLTRATPEDCTLTEELLGERMSLAIQAEDWPGLRSLRGEGESLLVALHWLDLHGPESVRDSAACAANTLGSLLQGVDLVLTHV
jgi:hypothetical protein